MYMYCCRQLSREKNRDARDARECLFDNRQGERDEGQVIQYR
jgi:hypothetical protein